MAGRSTLIRQGLKDLGFVEGQNVLIEYRSADGHYERVKDLADDLVRRQVAVIVVIGGVSLAAKAATSTIPLVFAIGGDFLEIGLVKNFNKPEANLTGMSLNVTELAPKRFELLRALVPHATLFSYLDNLAEPRPAATIARQELVASSHSVGVEVVVFNASTVGEIDSAFETMAQQGVQAVIVSNDAYLATRTNQIISLAKLHALPASYTNLLAIRRGGLMSYTVDAREMYRRAGVYAGRLLQGAKVADIPVEMPTKFSLGINLNTAKALGLTIPPNLLAIADEVIE